MTDTVLFVVRQEMLNNVEIWQEPKVRNALPLVAILPHASGGLCLQLVILIAVIAVNATASSSSSYNC